MGRRWWSPSSSVSFRLSLQWGSSCPPTRSTRQCTRTRYRGWWTRPSASGHRSLSSEANHRNHTTVLAYRNSQTCITSKGWFREHCISTLMNLGRLIHSFRFLVIFQLISKIEFQNLSTLHFWLTKVKILTNTTLIWIRFSKYVFPPHCRDHSKLRLKLQTNTIPNSRNEIETGLGNESKQSYDGFIARDCILQQDNRYGQS